MLSISNFSFTFVNCFVVVHGVFENKPLGKLTSKVISINNINVFEERSGLLSKCYYKIVSYKLFLGWTLRNCNFMVSFEYDHDLLKEIKAKIWVESFYLTYFWNIHIIFSFPRKKHDVNIICSVSQKDRMYPYMWRLFQSLLGQSKWIRALIFDAFFLVTEQIYTIV